MRLARVASTMTKVVIDMTMSLDGFVAGPGDGKEYPLGKNDGMRIFDWYFSGKNEYRNPLFRPEPGVNLDQVKRMYGNPAHLFSGGEPTTSPTVGTVRTL